MKKKLLFAFITVFASLIFFFSCKKENFVAPVVLSLPPTPMGDATINFHIKNINGNPGYTVYLYRWIVDSLSSSYTGGHDIYLRPNIDTIFKYQLFGNTNNLFIVGSTPDDNTIIYQELRYIPAGSNIDWNISY
jgi:hypothetical protein